MRIKTLLIGHKGWFGLWTESCAYYLTKMGGLVDIIPDCFFSMATSTYRSVSSHEIHKRILTGIEKNRPDLLLILKGENVSFQTLKLVKKNFPKIRTATWWADDPIIEQRKKIKHKDIFKKIPIFDAFFISDSYFLQRLKKSGAKNPYYLPLAYNYLLAEPISKKTEEQYDVVFIGNCDKERSDYIEGLKNFQINIWGSGWDTIKRKNIKIHKPIKSSEAFKIYASSKIALCISRMQLINGVDMRAFDIPACNTFLLSSYRKDLSKLYKIGKEIETFKSINELIAKTAFYLKSSSRRIQIAKEGRNRAFKNHSYETRMEFILKSLNFNKNLKR